MYNTRNILLDLIRTLAIVLMVIFHFIYDLRYFGWLDWHIPDGDGWKHFRYVILTLFFICIGAGLVYGHKNYFHARKFFKRLIQVSIGALLITLMSLIMFSESWVYFGVLHFIALASMLAIGFVNYPKISLITGGLIIFASLFGLLSKHWPFYYINEYLPDYTTDYVPLFPWLGVVLFGIWLAYQPWFNKPWIKETKLTRKLAWLGQHSLIIYLIHQPILFAILAPIAWLTRH